MIAHSGAGISSSVADFVRQAKYNNVSYFKVMAILLYENMKINKSVIHVLGHHFSYNINHLYNYLWTMLISLKISCREFNLIVF